MRFLLVFLVILSGCATAPQTIAPLKPGIYRVSDGAQMTVAEFVAQNKDAKVILVGESHDSAQDHALQAKVYNALLGQSKTSLGMEMFQRPFQAHLDAYVAGTLDEAELLAATEYEARWGYETEFYSPLWRSAQKAGAPIVALNIHRELTKRVSAVGTENLSSHEQALLPEIVIGPDEYGQQLKDIFKAHGMELSDDRFRRFFQAQLLWDETMAETAVNHLKSTSGRMMIVVGRGHVERGWGIPSRIQRRAPSWKVVSLVSVTRFDSIESIRRDALSDYVAVY